MEFKVICPVLSVLECLLEAVCTVVALYLLFQLSNPPKVFFGLCLQLVHPPVQKLNLSFLRSTGRQSYTSATVA